MALNTSIQSDASPVAKILTNLTNLGVTLWVEADELHFRAPKGAMTGNLIAEVKAHRAVIIAHVLAAAEVIAPTTSRTENSPSPLLGKTGDTPQKRISTEETMRSFGGSSRCVSHSDRSAWDDQPAVNGRIRTICRRCGVFIGYRPECMARISPAR